MTEKQYSADQVRAMIELEKEKYGWDFVFLGANIDAVQTAAEFRESSRISDEHFEAIRRDRKKRGVRK